MPTIASSSHVGLEKLIDDDAQQGERKMALRGGTHKAPACTSARVISIGTEQRSAAFGPASISCAAAEEGSAIRLAWEHMGEHTHPHLTMGNPAHSSTVCQLAVRSPAPVLGPSFDGTPSAG